MLVQDVQETSQRRDITSVSLQFSKWGSHVAGPNFRPIRPDDTWAPSVDIYEDDVNYYFIVELAGMNAEDIDMRIDAEKDIIVVSGDRPSPAIEAPQGPVRLHVLDIDHGRFCRSIAMPPNADLETVSARYRRNGLLYITVAKRT